MTDTDKIAEDWAEWGAMFGFKLDPFLPTERVATFMCEDNTTLLVMPRVARDAIDKALMEAIDKANRLGRRGLSPGDVAS